MKSDFQKMSNRAIEIREEYSKVEKKKWDIDQIFMGVVKDFGDLSELLMIKRGYRGEMNEEVQKKIEHEMADILWVLLVLAKKIDVDLEKGFWKTMDELEIKIKKQKNV